MKTQIFLTATLGLTFFATVALQAQQVQVKAGTGIEIKGVEIEAQNTPEFQAGGVKDKKIPNPREWMEVEVEFEAKGVAPRDAIIPELLFRYYIAFKDESGKNIVLNGDTTYTEVVSGEKMYSAVYVSPSMLGKITGDFRRFDEGKVQAVGVEVFYNGVLVGGYSSKGGKFWESLQRQPGVLAKDKTPFALLWLDRYPSIKAQ